MTQRHVVESIRVEINAQRRYREYIRVLDLPIHLRYVAR